MIESLIEIIEKAYEPARHRELLTALWEQERFFDTPRQRRAAEIARDVMAAASLREVAVVPYAADGRTRWQDWTTHMAWDCPAATVRLGEQVLADRAACPASVVYWSGPLEETSAAVVDGDAVGGLTAERVAGRYVLTSERPRDLKQRLLGRGAVGVLSDYLGRTRGSDDDTTKWCNTWADGPDGWYFRAGDERMPGFCLSPRAGRTLRKAMAAEPTVQVTAHCDSRLYEGQGQCVTGVVPGRDGGGREVWLFGHACEQGAHDNASGVSTYLEAACLLNKLIESGALPRPRLSIRVITTEEGLGMLSFATEHPELLERAVVGLNVDSVGDASEPDRPYYVYYGPLSAPNFGWAAAGLIAGRLAARSGGAYHTACKCEPPCSDDMIADPNCGVPTLWIGNGANPTGYHSSSDTPDVCTEASLRNNLVLTAAWAYTMANMDDRMATAILPQAMRWMEATLLAGPCGDALRLRRWVAGQMIRHLGRWGVAGTIYERAATRYCPGSAGPLDSLPTAGPRYTRTTWGTCTLETLPPARTEGLSRWNAWQNAALFWTHGNRPIAAVERLTRAEIGRVPDGALAHLMEACVQAGAAKEEGK
jgi:hypothetical protein